MNGDGLCVEAAAAGTWTAEGGCGGGGGGGGGGGTCLEAGGEKAVFSTDERCLTNAEGSDNIGGHSMWDMNGETLW